MNKPTAPKEKPMNFIERFFARLEYLMSKKTMTSRERFARHAGQQNKPQLPK